MAASTAVLAGPLVERSGGLVLPEIAAGPKRAITTDDLIALRDIDTLSLSPDGRHFAILVHQADPVTNDYRTGWFIGAVAGGALIPAGDGGEVRIYRHPFGTPGGDLVGSISRWSADGRWIAYTVKRKGEIQLWRSSVDGRVQERLTRNEADIFDFAWNEEGSKLFFTVGRSRKTLEALDAAGARAGFSMDELQGIGDVIHRTKPSRPQEKPLQTWVVWPAQRIEQPANADEAREFELMKARNYAWGRDFTSNASRDVGDAPAVVASTGAQAWLVQANESDRGDARLRRLAASVGGDRSKAVICRAPECLGSLFMKWWWSADGRQVFFWRRTDTAGSQDGFYTWAPASGAVETLFSSAGDQDSLMRECYLSGQRLVCLRETPTQPLHVAAIDIASRRVHILADVNPEFKNLELGRVERFEWELPPDRLQLGYPERGRGFILYPPRFDPARRYPAFVAPYSAGGFKRGDIGDEHPLFVYAAHGLLVINSEFPFPLKTLGQDDRLTRDYKMYSREHGYVHVEMNLNSTARAMDTVLARACIDAGRIGIGGISQATAMPLHMLLKFDRLAAVSVAGGGATQALYDARSRAGRAFLRQVGIPEEHREQASPDYWAPIDLADHVDQVEAPILFHVPDREIHGSMRLQRRLDDAQKPYEMYVFPDEYHVKWQPAHRHAIYNRNLDWFRFWLQDYEDPNPAKAQQYAKWRQLRELQCRNPRSLRDFCAVAAEQ